MLNRFTDCISSIKPKDMNKQLLFSMLAYLILTPIDSIVYIQWINGMINYKWLSSAIVFPAIGALFFYVPYLWDKGRGYIKPESTDLKRKYLVILSIFDSTSAILGSMTIPYISIVFMVLLGRISLPLTMVLSYNILDRRYHWNHYAGVGLTLFGIILTIIPSFYSQTDHSTSVLAVIIYLLSNVPGVLGYIYKEKFLKGKKNLNMWWMNASISFWQIIFGLFTIPMLFIPLKNVHVSPEDLPSYVSDGVKCQFAGINSEPDDNCHLSLLWLIIYQVIGAIANILMFMILKYGSSLVFLVLATLKTPITGFLGYILMSYNLIYTTDAQKAEITVADYFSLIFIVAGSLIYNIKSEYTLPKVDLEEPLLVDEDIKIDKMERDI